VLLNDPGMGVLDIIRFNGDGTLIFYSDNIDGFDALADTPSPPFGLYANNITLTEVGPEGSNSAVYAPTAGQPGLGVVAGQPVTYVFLSDVLEPGTMFLLGCGLTLLAVFLFGSSPALCPPSGIQRNSRVVHYPPRHWRPRARLKR